MRVSPFGHITKMPSAISFRGVYPILATPFRDDETLDLESFDRLIRFMVDLQVDGVTVLGVLGESNRMLDREREDLIRTAVKASGGRLPIIVGTSHSGTQAALGLSRMAEQLGAHAIMVTPQAEPVPNDDRVFEYYRTIAEGIRIPLVVQDHPASTAVHMSVSLMLRIVNEIPGVACVKEEATPTPPKIRALVQGMKRPVPILTGLGALYGQFDLEAGSHGFNTGFAFPEVLMAIVKAMQAGNSERAQALYTRFLPLIVFEQQPGVAVRKEIFRLRGVIRSARVRHPGANIQPAVAEQLQSLIAQVLPGADISKPIVI
ncbi:MAG: dihydrodipicolinate synthase family protein [Proteobacteria bacterium]|nr:MAG: dihydrodipicolinate synthase family protein [Pseudomonadota bacterium]